MDKQSLRIAMIGTKGVPATYGGIERHVEEVGRRLAERGHEVTVYCRTHYTRPSRERCEVLGPRHWRYEGMDLRVLPSLPTKHLDAITHTTLAALREFLCSHDVVHFHALGPSLLSWVPRIAGRRVVATVHGLDWQRRKWGPVARRVLRMGEWAIVHWPHATVVVSRDLERYFRQHYRCETHYIPNGITLPEPRPAREITERWGLEPGGYFLFLSRLVPEKRADLLIEAYRRAHPRLKLVIAGGSSHSDDHVEALHRLARGEPGIVFTGNVTGQLYEELMSNAYAFVLPSELEGLPIVLLEAMAFGRCCLASDIPVNIEVLEDRQGRRHGRIFPSGRVDRLAEELLWLEGNPGEVERLGRDARPHVERNYSWERVTDLLEKLYFNLLTGRPNA